MGLGALILVSGIRNTELTFSKDDQLPVTYLGKS